MKIDCVFSGGGVKAFAYIGALQSLQAKNIQIKRVAGTSAGAIVAALLAADYEVEEIDTILKEMPFDQLLDPPVFSKQLPIVKWMSLYFKMGLYKGDKLEQWLTNLLNERGIYTFADIEPGYLKVIISDISLGKLVVIPDDMERIYDINPDYFSVATAIRMSASFPYFFIPKKLRSKPHGSSYIVDGGILSNFPLWVFRKEQRDHRPVLGITLSDSSENAQPMKMKNAIDMLRGLFLAMMRAHDARYVSKQMQDDVIFIPVKEVSTMDFSMNDTEKGQLIQLGRDVTADFLQYWPK